MRVLVTGGAGFIGSNLCRRLTSGTVPGVDDRVPPSQPPFNNVPAPATRVDLNRLPLPTPTYPFQEQALARRYIDDA